MDKWDLFHPTAQLKIAVTSQCTNNCSICFNKTGRLTNQQRSDIPKEKILDLLDEASNIGFIGAYWVGGEPLLRFTDLVDSMQYATKKGMLSTVVTNSGPIGAIGKYKSNNVDLLKRSGLFNLSAEEIVQRLQDAGLTKIYLSVDNSHSTLLSSNSAVITKVPTEVASLALSILLDRGYGFTHQLQAIGPRLRVSAVSSGKWRTETDLIIKDLMERTGLSLVKQTKDKSAFHNDSEVYEDHRGTVYVRYLGVFALGAALSLPDHLLEDREGEDLFSIRCQKLKKRINSYDNGKYHGDFFVNYDGCIYLCGDKVYPVGNIYLSSLSQVIDEINSGYSNGPFSASIAVFHRLLRLSQVEGIGDCAIGYALKMVYQYNPALLMDIRTEGGACNALSTNSSIQEAFIRLFDEKFG